LLAHCPAAAIAIEYNAPSDAILMEHCYYPKAIVRRCVDKEDRIAAREKKWFTEKHCF
jgi:hypothetical protein